MNQLQILRCLALNSKVTQAELAQMCDLSVAMVNNYMKELCSAGYLEYHRKSIKSVTYHLTEAGFERIRIIERDGMLEMAEFYAGSKREIRDRILSVSRGKLHRVVLFGRGHLAEMVYHALEASDVRVIGVCDHKTGSTGREWCGRELVNPAQIRYMLPDAVVVADTENTDAICRSLASLVELGIRVIRWDSIEDAAENSGGTRSVNPGEDGDAESSESQIAPTLGRA